MSQKSRGTLDGYFQTGSIPSQSNFNDLIDSFINEKDDQVFVDTSQNVGIGIPTPSEKLEVNGNVKAAKFIGNGSELTKLSAANLIGTIPQSSIPPGTSHNTIGIQSFSVNKPIVTISTNYTGVTLSWEVHGAHSIELTYLDSYCITKVSSSSGAINLSIGTHPVKPDLTQTYTLTAYNSLGNVLNQVQLTIVVVPDINDFMKNLHTNSKSASEAASAAVKAFSLENLCQSNVTLLAKSMSKNGLYTPLEIIPAIQKCFTNLFYKWNKTNVKWVSHALN